jgi:tetratricopeptide (TPR) repeat protein
MENKLKRIRNLGESLNENPSDPFFKYALALEYLKSDIQKSKTLLKEVILNNREYIPSYYTFGKILYEESDYKTALTILLKGRNLAQKEMDLKSVQEISALIHTIEMEL